MNFPIFIYYISFLSFPTLILFSFLHKKAFKNNNKKRKALFIILILLNLVFIEARFIEPNIIIVKKTEIKSSFDLNVALISDLHLGVWKGKSFLERVVQKINNENIDIVIIAGDFTYYPEKSKMYEIFSPLKNLKVPVYAILGNHDVEKPGAKIRNELEIALKELGVNLLNNEKLKFKDINIVGLGELWNNESDVSILNNFKKEDRVLTIIHNPDVSDFFVNENSDITLAGHTHGGQIRIPYLYKKVMPTIGDYDKGIYYKDNTTLFISPGLGEIGLPMRFLNPPEIDILEIRKK